MTHDRRDQRIVTYCFLAPYKIILTYLYIQNLKFKEHLVEKRGNKRTNRQRWRRYNTLCTSGFVDDVMFSYNGPYGGVLS